MNELKTFISYRRNDLVSRVIVGRIYDRFANQFGTENTFMDVDSIPVGADFRSVIQQEVSRADVMLVLIGPDWEALMRDRGSLPDDFVRIEIETALSLNMKVVPILVDHTSMPRVESLPDSLQQLAYHNAFVVDGGRDFHSSTDRLIKQLIHSSEQVSVEVQDDKSVLAFISHSSDDREWVEGHILNTLVDAGIAYWISSANIRSAVQWEREILSALRECDWFVLVSSPRSANSEWVKDELSWAFSHRPNNIVNTLMEEVDLYDFHIRLPRLQYIDFTADLKEAKSQLASEIISGGFGDKG